MQNVMISHESNLVFHNQFWLQMARGHRNALIIGYNCVKQGATERGLSKL